MRNIWTIAKREYNAYFNSPLAYVVMTLLFGVIGIIFALNLISVTSNAFFAQALDPTLVAGPLLFMLLFCTPALTMRLISEESRTGTLELLLTAGHRQMAGRFSFSAYCSRNDPDLPSHDQRYD